MADYADVAISDEITETLGDNTNFYRNCHFCGKETLLHSRVDRIIGGILKSNQFYCGFCIRHDLHTKKGKDVLVLSYRGIIGHLFYNGYLVKDNALYVSEIQDMIDLHVECGLLNPIFTYDPETYCWFIDFRKVGDTKKRRVSLDEVINTVNDMLSCFNLYTYAKEFKGSKLAAKFEEALVEFYKNRARPADKKLLIPTLVGCADLGVATATQNGKKAPSEMREFLPKNLKMLPKRA